MKLNTPQPDARGWYSIAGEPTANDIRGLNGVGHIDCLAITKSPLITVQRAKRLCGLRSVSRLWLWCDVTRAAMCRLIRIPGLQVLDVLAIRWPGVLGGFEHALSLHTFRANHYLTEADLLEVAKCAALRVVGVQHADLTNRSLDALLALPHLVSLDFEGTAFDDEMAERLSHSLSLQSLDVGATRLTRTGLEHLSTMAQLRSLDLWATHITEVDVELLKRLPALEYVSLGGYHDGPGLETSKLVPLLLSLPALKRVWLDGLTIDPVDADLLRKKLEYVRITEPDTHVGD